MKKREYVNTPQNAMYIALRNEFISDRDGKTLHTEYEKSWKRLAKCQAWYKEDGDFIWLKSYNTIVAVYNKVADIVISYGRYSATTYQHIRKFRSNIAHTYNERNLEFENWY